MTSWAGEAQCAQNESERCPDPRVRNHRRVPATPSGATAHPSCAHLRFPQAASRHGAGGSPSSSPPSPSPPSHTGHSHGTPSVTVMALPRHSCVTPMTLPVMLYGTPVMPLWHSLGHVGTSRDLGTVASASSQAQPSHFNSSWVVGCGVGSRTGPGV